MQQRGQHGRHGHEMIEVVLEEEDDDERVDLPRGPSLRDRLRAWWSMRPAGLRSGTARFGAVVGALSLVAVVAHQGAGAADEAAVSARIAATSGLSVSLSAPLHEVWHLDEAWPQGWMGEDVLVHDQATGSLVRLDPGTGEARWSAAVDGWCTSSLDGPAQTMWFTPQLPELVGERLACEVFDRTAAAGQAYRAVLVSAADGAVVPGPALDGSPMGMTLVEGDIVLLSSAVDGRLLALRWSPDSERTVWSHTSTEAVLDGGQGYGIGWGPGYVQVDGSRTVILDLTTGQEIASLEEATGTDGAGGATQGAVTLSDGSTVHMSSSPDAALVRTAADGTPRPDFPGWPVVPGSDDGSAGALAFAVLSDGSLAAVDLDTSRTRWTTGADDGTQGLNFYQDGGFSQVIGVLGGRVVLAGTSTIAVLDASTGEGLWSQHRPMDQWGGTAVSDGRVLAYVQGSVPEGTGLSGVMELTAVDLGTGDVVARTPLDTGAVGLLGAAPDGTVLLMSDDRGLVGLRP